MTGKVGRNLLLKLEAMYLKSNGRNNDELIRIGPSVTYAIGELELSLGGYQAFYEQEDTKGQTTYVTFNLTRKF
jgi:hypothetical protein